MKEGEIFGLQLFLCSLILGAFSGFGFGFGWVLVVAKGRCEYTISARARIDYGGFFSKPTNTFQYDSR